MWGTFPYSIAKVHLLYLYHTCGSVVCQLEIRYSKKLTLYHTIPTINDPAKEEAFLKTLLEKEKMLVTIIFSFFHRFPKQSSILKLIFLLSAKSSKLDWSKILFFDNELSFIMACFTDYCPCFTDYSRCFTD